MSNEPTGGQPAAAEGRRPQAQDLPGETTGEPYREDKERHLGLWRWSGAFVVVAGLAGLASTYYLRAPIIPISAVAGAGLVALGLTGEVMFSWASKRLRREREQLQRMWLNRQAELEEIACKDDLTQLQNRRFFYDRLQQELAWAASHRKALSILMMDVDDLKAINDEFGHQVGDIVLRRVGRILNAYTEERHVTARLGGDEFAVIMPGADRREADRMAAHLCEELAAAPVYETEHASIYVGVSVGSSGYPWGGTDLEEIIHWADTKLYANKLERKGFRQNGNGKKENRLASAVVDVLSTALDIRDRMTHRHARRVSRMAAAVARQLGLPDATVLEIEYAAALHDIGKIGVADSILRKAAPLDHDEWKDMRRHSELGYEILKGIDFLKNAAEIIYAHHEQFDGSGYPRGLVREEIPLGARVFAVVDAYDAMTSRRPYRDAMPREAALAEIARNTGTQFDPQVVETFLAIVTRSPDGFYEEVSQYGATIRVAGSGFAGSADKHPDGAAVAQGRGPSH